MTMMIIYTVSKNIPSLAIALTHIQQFQQLLPRDAVQAQISRHAGLRCLSVCLVTFVHPVKMNKHIFKNFSPSGSQAILVFPY